jgi:uncharacterized protein (DUF885 family)
MKKPLTFLSYGVLITLVVMCTSKKDVEQSKSVTEIVDSLSNDYWQREQKTGRSFSFSDPIFPEQLYKGTRQDFFEDSVYFSFIQKKLSAINPSDLSGEMRTDYDLLEWIASIRLESTKYYDNYFPPITPYAFNLGGDELLFKSLKFTSTEDLIRYVHLLEEYKSKLSWSIKKLRYQSTLGIRLPKKEIELTAEFLKSFQAPASSLSFYVDVSRLAKIDSSLRKGFQTKVSTSLEKDVKPLFDSLVNYLSSDYLLKAPEAVGLAQYPNGKEYYKYLVRWHTSTNLTPEEIHKLGRNQVEQISLILDSIRKTTGFKGTRKGFFKFLQTDKRFFAKTPDEVGFRLKGYLSKMDQKISTVISIKPKAGYDVRRLPLAAEPGMTFGYYAPPSETDSIGIYFYNGSKLDKRSLTQISSIAYHEIMPGHHWQVGLQIENDSTSTLQKNFFSNAFAEGWGDYSAYLGIELGLYSDPYDYCGRLLMDMFISLRLVVDTGMNYLGWSWEQATAFMQEYSVESEEQIKTETLRYSSDIQGQALGYKIGSLKIIEFRNKYKKKLGDKFNLIKFHDTLLKGGALPLDVLEKKLDREFGINNY